MYFGDFETLIWKALELARLIFEAFLEQIQNK